MPRRIKKASDEELITDVSKKAIEQRLGKKVEVEAANETPIREEIVRETVVEEVTPESNDSIDIPEGTEQNIGSTISVTPYGDNYYKINMDDLPTKGKLYGGKEIYLRNFKVIEIKRLSTVDENTANDVINDIMSKLVKGVEFEQIAAVDKIALLFYVRMNTFPDPKYKINFTCTNMVPDEEGGERECGHQNQLFFTANDLEIKQLDDSFTMDDLRFNLPNGDEIRWRLPVVADEKNIIQAVNQIKIDFESHKDYKDIEVDSDIVAYAFVITMINGNELSVADKYLYITEVLTPQDFVVLTDEMNNKYDIGVNTMIKTTCSKCGGRVSVPVMFSSEFFLPQYTS